MVEVRVTEKAYKDLEAIAEFIARDSEKYAKVLVQQFYSSILVLQNFPLSGRVVPEVNLKTVRELILGNYRIIYFVLSTKRIDIIALHHSAKLLSKKQVKINLK